jgi:HYDIN/CFA65/VesB family protein/putative pyrroloquinoline-quinone-binding quinoprotein
MFSLFAINPDGSIKWHTPMDNQVFGLPAIGDDGTVYVASEDGKMSAFGQATASMSAPASLDFGSSPLWNTVTRTFTIANSGSVNLFIKDASLSNHCGFRDFTLDASTCPTGRLAPGISCAIAVTFSPLAIGSRSVPLTITDNASSGSQTVMLRGTGTPDLTMSEETLVWNRVKAGSSSSRRITIANHQTIPVALSASIGGASGHDFSVSPGSCKKQARGQLELHDGGKLFTSNVRGQIRLPVNIGKPRRDQLLPRDPEREWDVARRSLLVNTDAVNAQPSLFFSAAATASRSFSIVRASALV